MKNMNWKMLASCMAALCMTAVVSAAVPCDQKSECTSTKAVQAKLVETSKTCDAKSESCPIEKAAKAYWSSILEVQQSTDEQFCTGGAAMKGLMAVMADDEQYAPLAAKLKTWMAEQRDQAVAQTNATKQCDGAKKVAQINAKNDRAKTCDGDARKVAQINAKNDRTKTCDGDAKKVAQVNAKDGCCASQGKRVAQVNATDGAKSCDGTKAGTARFTAFNCNKTDRVARTAARAYMSIMVELKEMSGYEGCPMAAAQKTLMAAMQDLQTDRAQADASDDADATTVSMAAMRDGKDKAGCCSKK